MRRGLRTTIMHASHKAQHHALQDANRRRTVTVNPYDQLFADPAAPRVWRRRPKALPPGPR